MSDTNRHTDISTYRKHRPKGPMLWKYFTKPPLLQESRLTSGNSPNLVDLVERKVPVEWRIGAANSFHSFKQNCTLVLYKQLIQTGSVLLLLHFPLCWAFLSKKIKKMQRCHTWALEMFGLVPMVFWPIQQTNKQHIIVISWAVKAVTVGKAPPFPYSPLHRSGLDVYIATDSTSFHILLSI